MEIGGEIIKNLQSANPLLSGAYSKATMSCHIRIHVI